MNTLWQDVSYKTQKLGSKLYLLIGVNIAVFLLALILPSIESYLRLPAYLPALKTSFWTPITYMFVNDGFLGVVFNMLWLYWMGQIFEEYLGYKRTLGLYILGGLAGAALFIIAFAIPGLLHVNNFALFSIAGASASVIAIMIATTTFLPNHTIIIFIWPVKLKWLMLIYGVIDVINILNFGAVVVIAHIGAALLGFVYIKRLQEGSDWIANIANLFRRGPGLSKLKVVARNTDKRASSRPRQDEVDVILDKISKVGYEHLSSEEKEVLFRASKNEG